MAGQSAGPGTAAQSRIDSMDLDVLIFGGGSAGLWLLAELTANGHAAVLLESGSLGAGQTIAAQGILHGGLKYTLQGLLTPAAEHVSAMPAIWRDCLAGRRKPNLSHTKVRAEFCYLWRTGSIASQLGMLGAKIGLQVTPQAVKKDDWPLALAGVPGTVARLDEQVIATESFVSDLREQFLSQIIQYDPKTLAFSRSETGDVSEVRIVGPKGEELCLRPRTLVLTAGAGNADLRQRLGLSPQLMQRRPLHMVLVRGNLPILFGHCVDGAKTRVTITSAPWRDHTVWQVGGQISEDGVRMNPNDLIRHTKAELKEVLCVSFNSVHWSTYRVDRAERAMPDNRRPETVQIVRDQNVFSCWPTKLVLAPSLAKSLQAELPAATIGKVQTALLEPWPKPPVALLPWEEPDRKWQ